MTGTSPWPYGEGTGTGTVGNVLQSREPRTKLEALSNNGRTTCYPVATGDQIKDQLYRAAGDKMMIQTQTGFTWFNLAMIASIVVSTDDGTDDGD